MLLLRLLSRQVTLRILGVIFLIHYSLFWITLRATEAPDLAILQPINYWYFWFTTSTSIGYGDLSPQSAGARLFAPFFQVTGVAIVTLLIGVVGKTLIDYSSKRKRGLMPTSKRNHILVLGDYHPIKTKTLITNAVADVIDDGLKASVVGCFRNTGEKNPFDRHTDYPDCHPEYIQVGEGGFNRQRLIDAGAETAAQIYISAADDATTIGIVGFLSRLSCTGRVVVLLHEEVSAEGIPDTDLDLHVIPPMQSMLAVREMGDPGTGAAVMELLSSDGSTMYSLGLASAAVYQEVRTVFEDIFGAAILLGFSRQNKDGTWTSSLAITDQNVALEPGDRLIYMAGRDLCPADEQRFCARLAA